MKKIIPTLQDSEELYEAIIDIAKQYGYKKSGDYFKDYNDDCVMYLGDYTINLSGVILKKIVIEMGLAIHQSKVKGIGLMYSGEIITRKQIKMLIEMEMQTA
ncbi:hypothetical protein [Pseudomonas syringae]|uniref:hypothetical protein n=1 Tax=Pseudomonas syringae TaxID=317 RepID=UPI00128F07EB|nr:hypothetical protein [Pseudomonas syringae]